MYIYKFNFSRRFSYTTMEQSYNETESVRHRCCNGWKHLPGENGCLYSRMTTVYIAFILEIIITTEMYLWWRDKMVTDKMVTDKMVTDKIVTDKMVTDKMVTDKMVTDEMVTNKMVTDKMETDI